MNPIPPLRLVLSGGGIRGISYVGAFIELEARGFLKNIREILGVSVGALFGFTYSIGYKTNELLEFVNLFDFTLITNVEPDSIIDFFNTLGIDNKDNLEKLIDSILRNKNYSPEITFEELYNKTKFHIRFLATNLNNCKIQEFSYKKTPNTKVKFGLLSSMCIPGFFTPCKDNNILYVDGAIMKNYPIDLIPQEQLHLTLGLTFSEDHIFVSKIETIEEYLYQIYACSYISKKHIIKEKTIIIPCGDYMMLNLSAPREDKEYLISLGKKAVKDYFELKQFAVKPIRRYSIS
jgi:NTE family protein